MATYDRVSPANLTNYALVIDDPEGGEDADKGWEVDLQTRRFVSDFLESKFNSATSDTLKPAAVNDATLAGKVKGSTGNAGTQQGIVQGTVSTPDIRDGAVTAAKIAEGALTGTTLANGSVSTVKLADAPNGVTAAKINTGEISTAKLAALAVTDAKLASHASDDASRAVGSDHIKALSVTSGKIAVGAVGPDQMATGSSAQILVADGSGKFQKVSLTGDASLSNTGVLTLSNVGRASVRERAGNNVDAGAAAAATWNTRGVATAWTKEWETIASMVTIGTAGKISLAAGTYIIETSCPAYKVDEHISRIARYNSSDVLQETFYGTSAVAAAAGGEQTDTLAIAKMTFAASDYFKVEHFSTASQAVDGLGHASGSGGTYEMFATIKIHKIA